MSCSAINDGSEPEPDDLSESSTPHFYDSGSSFQLPGEIPLSSSELSELIENLDEQSTRELLGRAQSEAEQFLIQYEELNGAAIEAVHDELTEWFALPTTQVTLAALTDEVLALLSQTVDPGFPGHDFRHMFRKDPLSALRYCVEDEIDDYRTTFLLSSLAHDLGRLVEHHLVETRLTEVPSRWHGEISFYFFSRLLDGHQEIPAALKNELRYAVLAHSSTVPSESFFLSAVQRADREQILGPEGIARLIAFDAGYGVLSLDSISRKSRRHTLTIPGELPHEHLSETLEFFLRNLAEPPGQHGLVHHHRAQIVAGVFLKLMSSEVEFQQTFHPELNDADEKRSAGHFKPRISEEVWAEIQSSPTASERRVISALCEQFSAQELLSAVVSGEGMADVSEAQVPMSGDRFSPVTIEEVLNRKLSELDESARERFSQALAYVLLMRNRFDEEEKEILQATVEAYPDRLSIPRRIAAEIERRLFSD